MRRRFLGLTLFCGLLAWVLLFCEHQRAYARLLADPSISFDGAQGNNPSSTKQGPAPFTGNIRATGTFDLQGTTYSKVEIKIRLDKGGGQFGAWSTESPAVQAPSYVFDKTGYTSNAKYEVKAVLYFRRGMPPGPEEFVESDVRTVVVK